MGLRLHQVVPPANLTSALVPTGASLNWTASTAAVTGYHVYRASKSDGLFTRLTSSLVAGTTFTDTTVPPSNSIYRVRAVKLETTPSGSYFNPSQGIFASVTSLNNLSPNLMIQKSTNSVMLNWNSQSGKTYRVQFKPSVSTTNWTELSGPISPNAATASWTDSSVGANPLRIYRVLVQ